MSIQQADWPERNAARLAACFLGATAFWAVGAPAPWLTGAAVTAAALALNGRTPRSPWWLLEAALLVLGVSLGESVGPDTVAAAGRWPISVLALLLTIPLIIGSAQLTLTRLFGWERREAFLAAVPGALSYTLAMAIREGLDVRPIAIAQSVRYMAIVLLAPLFFGPTAQAQQHAAQAVAPGQLLEWMALLAFGLAAGVLLQRIKTPAALLIGGLVISCIAHGAGLANSALPSWLLIPAIAVVGINVGARFGGSDPKLLAAMLVPAVASTAMTFLAAALAALATARLLHLPTLQVVLAFAPGGLEAIAVLVLTLKLDAAYVTIHQLIRFLGIAATLPVVFRLWNPRGEDLPNT